MFFGAVMLSASLLFMQCGKSTENRAVLEECEIAESEEFEIEPYGRENSESDQTSSADVTANLKLEKRASLSMETKEVGACRKSVDSLMKRYRGYVEQEKHSNYRVAYNLMLRIPSASLDSFLAGFSGVSGNVVEKNVSVTDRTAEYTDLSSRRKTQDAMLERYRQMLKTATKVSDMLEIQRRIDEIQMEADRAQGRLNRIDKDVDYSVMEISIIDLNYVAPYYTKPDNSLGLGDFGEALVNGWHGVVAVVWFLFNIWPLWIVAAGAVFIIKKRRAQKK